MTLKTERSWNCTSSSYSGQNSRKNSSSAVVLKRYLDLTLRGTRQNLSNLGNKSQTVHHTLENSCMKHRVSPSESENYNVQIPGSPDLEEEKKPPAWVNEMNSRVVNHRGEAPIFAENCLSYYKVEQTTKSQSRRQRPLSGISTKSAPVVINGSMYHRPSKTHSYLQASRRPASAIQDRMTRAANLRKNHQSKAMVGNPSDSTKDDLQRIKDSKPLRHELNKDLLPIPCHNNESAHSFIIGARYNCSNFMDSRSFSRLGLYVPRSNPLGTFLKVYRGDETVYDDADEQDHVEKTSVRTSGSTKNPTKRHVLPLGDRNGRTSRGSHSTINSIYVRKVFKEAWLAGSEENSRRAFPSRSGRGSPVPPHPSPKPRQPGYGCSLSSHPSSASSKSSKKRRSKPATSGPAFTNDRSLRNAVFDVETAMSSSGDHLRRNSSSRRVIEME